MLKASINNNKNRTLDNEEKMKLKLIANQKLITFANVIITHLLINNGS
jgi:hypothetical protein